MARALAWRGSPVDPSIAYINTPAIEPGVHWVGADFRIVGESFTATGAETRRFIPVVSFQYRGNARTQLDHAAREELEAAVRRAFKVWTRHLESDRSGESYGDFVVEVGGASPCGSHAIACAHGSGVLVSPTMYIPDATAALVQGGVSIAVFGVLAHEVGHMLDYDDDPFRRGFSPTRHRTPGS